jgi:hypothetical protein
MPTTFSRVSPLAAVALAAALARPAAAQPAVAVSSEAAPRTIATYRFTGARDGTMPTQVTIADSSGVLLASFRLPGDRAARPMAIDLTDSDLVLQGETPAGVLTLRFYQPADAASKGLVSGRWWLGEQDGVLRGRVTR